MSQPTFQRCVRCVMDNSSDLTIEFDVKGVCNYCTDALARPEARWSHEEKETKLSHLLEEMKKAGANGQYDCIMGLSGGLDSSYLALLGHRWGLRVLAVHIDDGFDSEVSKENIRRLVAATGFDYLTVRPDASQFAELTKAYMRAGVPNLAVPQDNVLFAFLHEKAKQFGIRYFASGGNFALESILQRGNTHSAYDMVNLRDIWKKHGKGRLDRLKFLSTYGKQMDERVRGVKSVRPLDYIDYNKDVAMQELEEFCGFQYYGSKHLENRLTEFVQLYWMPSKFGVDKRTSHFSSLIVSGQMSRDDALSELKAPAADPDRMSACLEEVQSGLGLSPQEFEDIMAAPARQHDDYAVQDDTLLYKVLGAWRSTRRFREAHGARGRSR